MFLVNYLDFPAREYDEFDSLEEACDFAQKASIDDLIHGIWCADTDELVGIAFQREIFLRRVS